MRRVILLLASSCWLVMSAAGFGVASASPADDTVTPLPFSTVRDMVVDGERGIVVVSGQAFGHDGVAVLDLSGHVQGIVPIAAPGALAVVGDEAFVSQLDPTTLAVIDLGARPLAVTRTLTLSPYAYVTDLALADGRLWATCVNPEGDPVLVTIDPATGRASDELPPHGALADHADRADGPIAYGSLAGGDGLTVYHPAATGLDRVDVVPPPHEMVSQALDGDVMPGGQSVVVAGASERGALELSITDGSVRQVYGPDAQTMAVDVRDDGRIATLSMDMTGTPRAWVYESGSSEPVWRHDFVAGSEGVPPAAIAWAPTGDALFVILADRNQAAGSAFYVIHTIGGVPGGLPTPTARVAAPSPVPEGTHIPLPYAQVGATVIDDATQRIFISEGANGDEVIVVGLDGAVEGTIRVPMPTRMALAGDRLFVVSPSTRSIRTFDTDTTAAVGTIDLGSIGTPTDVAYQGGSVWATISTTTYPVLVELGDAGIRRSFAFKDSPGDEYFLPRAGSDDVLALASTTGIQVLDTAGQEIRRTDLFSWAADGECQDFTSQIWHVTAGVLLGCPPSDRRFTAVFGDVTHLPGGPALGSSYSSGHGGRTVVVATGLNAPVILLFEGERETPVWTADLPSLDASLSAQILSQGVAIDEAGATIAVVVTDPAGGGRVIIVQPDAPPSYPSPRVLTRHTAAGGSSHLWIFVVIVLITVTGIGAGLRFANRDGSNDDPPTDTFLPSRPDVVRR